MDKFDTLQLFARIVELGSFSRAADQIGIPRATASNAIKELENHLECRLLERTTRHVKPSLDGQAFYERCIHILSELDDAESSLRHMVVRPRGVLRIDLHGAHATRIVLPNIDEFHTSYPDIELVISSGDRIVDLVREGIDCVIRAGTLNDSSLVARHLAVMPQVICASPEYLRRYGIPRHPEELGAHQCVNFFSTNGGVNYPLEIIINSEVHEYYLKSWMTVNDAENYVLCALRGAGLVQLPRYHVKDLLRDGDLVEVLSGWQSPGLPVSALYPHHRQLSPRVRVFIDWLINIYNDQFPTESKASSTHKYNQ
ncbi:LysR family transcriptional regulator [Rouxiella silvae]|uniref:LysR family transcriptional regulator n=1 Tax=Rouxiella silvae TaxID=1646373 RepID=A0ABX3TX99_9GAMM|nr:LysR family transcriptional regulator [Rouxiella silvae]ORJ19857.1 LysR family transcriptional regulator [Rouxiella silvae]